MNIRHLKVYASLFALTVFLTGCEKPEVKAAKYMQRGNDLFEQGDYEKARVEFKNAARLKPTDAEILFSIGRIEEAEGNLHSAFGDFTHAEEQNPHFHPAVLKLAEYYLAAEQYDQAQKRLDSVLADDPNDADAHALLAAMYMHQKKYDDTEKEARLALSKKPNDVIAYSILAGLYQIQGDMPKALATVNESIESNPKELSLLMLKASLYERMGDLPNVADTFQAVFKLKPKERRFRLELAQIYVKLKKIDEAEATLRAGVEAMPDDWGMKRQLAGFLAEQRSMEAAENEIHGYMQANPDNQDLPFWLVDLYMSRNATDKATALLQQLASKQPPDKSALTAQALLARIAYDKGNKTEADKEATDVLAKDPGNREALFVKGTLAFEQGQYQNAVSDARIILRDDPQAKEAYPLLAESLMQQGHPDLALDAMKQLTDIDPLNFVARVRLAQLHHETGNSKHALELLAAVTESTPSYAPAWESTARIAIDIKDWSTAEKAVNKLVMIDDQKMTAEYLHGQILAATGKPDEAIASFTKVVDADPASPVAERALTSLVETDKGLNRIEDAVHYIEQLKSDSPAVATLLGECYVQLHKADLAAAAFDKAIANHSLRPETYLQRAALFLQDKKPDDALATLKTGAALVPADIRMPLLEAEIDGSLGRYQDAIALYDGILDRSPGMDAVANNLAEIIADYQYADPVALDKARKTAERFAGSTNPILLDTLAWVYYRQGDLPQAQTIMERALNGDAKVPAQVHYHYGLILYKSGKMDQAKTQLQLAIADNAQYPGIEDAKSVLNSIP